MTLIITPRTPCRIGPTVAPILWQHPIVGIDLETTGGSPDIHRIVEIGAVKMDPVDGTVLDRFSVITNPGNNIPLPRAAEQIHGISPGEIRAGQPIAAALEDLRAFIGAHGVVAHNLGFENRHLTAAYARAELPPPAWQGICTLATARAHLNAEKYNLQYLLDLLQIDAENTHRAESDAHGAGALLVKLMQVRQVAGLVPLDAEAAADVNGDEEQAIRLLAGELGATRIDAAATEPQTITAATLAPEPTPVPEAARRAADRATIFGNMTPTDEQIVIADAFIDGADMKVSARAGTGKTSTLLALSRVDPDRPGHYLAFNKSVATEGKRKFGKQVRVSTAHALAYQHIRSTAYGPLLAKLGNTRVPWHQVGKAIGTRVLHLDTERGVRTFGEYRMSRLALETVGKYCRTTDAEIQPWHVPHIEGLTDTERLDLADRVLPIARQAWKRILDPADRAVAFTPDHFLKLWASTHPRIGEPGGYLLFDEAQDANPIVREIVTAQDHLQRVWVGDEYQAIYGFTGATNSLAQLRDVPEYALTQSWRFGPAIAEAANVYLAKLGARNMVRGNPGRRDRITADRAADAVLCRTNGDALAEVIAAQAAGTRTALIGDADHARRFCESAAALQQGAPAKTPELEAFTTWGEVQDYVEHDPGVGDWKTLVSLIDDNSADVVRTALDRLADPSHAALTAVTCHKSKGLQFDRVRINSNWSIDEDDDNDPADRRAEQMLAYVSLTRAKTALNPGELLPGFKSSIVPEQGTPIDAEGVLF